MTDVNIKFVNGTYQNTDAIHNALSYIFHLDSKKPLPIRFYGVVNIGYPPDPKKLIEAFEENYYSQNPKYILPQQLWHMLVTMPFTLDEPYGDYFYMADSIARIFSYEYPVCYAYHTENKTTGNEHSHFHFIISTASYIPDFPALDENRMTEYLTKIKETAGYYNVNLTLKE
ncbi:hypothetical protein B5F07_19880 [Lachnoclostridium sp. An169]|uniref:hypothetical protein n=1 Tax=Lachnoclostridium sp. An169 TaxID=1965569 RepID=UPI000B39F2EE|nr:hypothetical protein [Lachnoclostridium sp. An169]OUP80767.1 hypothetical protein B5F07_19880 [Lachnoclostridium sp. An169]